MVPPDMADGDPGTDRHPVRAAGSGDGPIGHSDDVVKTLTGLSPLGAVLAPVARTFQRVRPAEGALPRVEWMRPADVAGALLARLTVLPSVLIVAWLIPGVPLLLAHAFDPVTALLISIPVAILLVVIGLRAVPTRWPRLLSADRVGEPGWATWFGLFATVAVVAGLTGWQLAEGSEALIVARDPGTYLQAGYWIAQHGSLPIPEALTAFGTAHQGLNFASTGYLTHGTAIYPSATPGLPLMLAGAAWAGGAAGEVALSALLGGLAVLSFAGLVARLAGPRWAPAGALLLGLSMPQQYVGRTTLSETALQIVLLGGLSLLADSVTLGRNVAAAGGWLSPADPAEPAGGWWARAVEPERALAALAGLALGFGLVLSLDALVYLVLIIPFGGALVIAHRRQAAPFPLGALVGACYGLFGCFLLDRPFLDSVGRTVGLAGVVAVWLIALSAVAVQLARLGWVRRTASRVIAARPQRWLPDIGALLVLAGLIGFAVRPYVQTVRGQGAAGTYDFVAALQRQQHLPVDPTRTYAEQSLYWLIWYIGLPAVLLGAFGLALVLRRCLGSLLTWRDPAGVWRVWALPAAIICAGSAVVLWDPGIAPDQPWASRRLVVFVIPGLIVCGLWAASWLAGRARDRGARPVTAGVVGACCFVAMLLPTVATTFGLGLTHASRGGGSLRPVAQGGMALDRVGVGQLDAVRSMCARIPGNASVVIVDWPTAAEFTQVVRGMCGVPTAWTTSQTASSMRVLADSIVAAGRVPVLLAGTSGQLAGFGGSPALVMDLTTTGDPHELSQVPTAPQVVRYRVWMTVPPYEPAGP